MKEVPNIISTKDLSYLEDMFAWHMTASKKAHHFSLEIKDESVRMALEETAKMHADICHQIEGILQGGTYE